MKKEAGACVEIFENETVDGDVLFTANAEFVKKMGITYGNDLKILQERETSCCTQVLLNLPPQRLGSEGLKVAKGKLVPVRDVAVLPTISLSRDAGADQPKMMILPDVLSPR